MAHLIGYVGEVTEDMLNQPQFELYNPGDVVGFPASSGNTRCADGKERGAAGVGHSHGREVGLLGETEAIPGNR